MAREAGTVNSEMGPGTFVVVLAVALLLPYLVYWLPQQFEKNAIPVVVGSYRGCDLIRGYDKERGESFYFTDCRADRIGASGPLPSGGLEP